MKLTSNYFIRISTAILFLIFFFQSFGKTDDIRNFQIEGMSLGESALKYFNKTILEDNKQYGWFSDKSKKFIAISELKLNSSKTYESFQIGVKYDDQDYKIAMLAGFVFYKDNINDCYKELDSIASDIKSLFNDINDLGKETYKHTADKSGKSSITDIILADKYGNEISIQCYDWSDELTYWDQLRIRIANKEYTDWLRY